ncbi:sigma-70 family RNA polymerase sigma factor [Fulvivirgaceae bacterium BMA12]|uniref:Sigma-70 family RNA polymerase sigma factor n=1 Tax=Agaribacillus aureus TaxID=3051825 RepID=A0ABT8LG15_9BACT|nr:sigma-70 family RNA polymerase sigma factor [Fulvivirgaceae bacterium BMA12]
MDRSHERKLVENLKTGCKSSFQKLFDIYHKKIYNISRKMGLSQENAEDVVQELFLFIWSKREILNPDHSFNAFLQIISKRLVFKQIKSEVNKVSFNAYLQQYGMAIDNQTDDYIVFSDLEAYSQKGLDNLSEKRKQIFMLSKQHGLSNDEIAEKLNISKRTVENQLYRATKAVNEHLKKENISRK